MKGGSQLLIFISFLPPVSSAFLLSSALVPRRSHSMCQHTHMSLLPSRHSGSKAPLCVWRIVAFAALVERGRGFCTREQRLERLVAFAAMVAKIECDRVLSERPSEDESLHRTTQKRKAKAFSSLDFDSTGESAN